MNVVPDDAERVLACAGEVLVVVFFVVATVVVGVSAGVLAGAVEVEEPGRHCE